MNNIKQLTNFGVTECSKITKNIFKNGTDSRVPHEYYIVNSSFLGSDTITKLGYCANNNEGINYPIFLTINGIETEFQLGKTGMFEFQEEEWRDVNADDTERIANPSVSQVLVPTEVSFVLDYCYPI